MLAMSSKQVEIMESNEAEALAIMEALHFFLVLISWQFGGGKQSPSLDVGCGVPTCGLVG